MAVCGNPENRHGIILAKNEKAKAFGISTAETIWKAKQKCPELILAPAHREEYVKYSKLVNEIYSQYTDLVEPFGIDESWLDVTGSERLFGDGKTIADSLRQRIREEVGLTISVGVSFNKIFAKLGSDYRKPDATTVISSANYQELVFPLPVSDLLFVGRTAKQLLQEVGIRTIGDLAHSDREMISRLMGKAGDTLWEYANGMDDSPVRPFGEEKEVKSVGNGMTFRRDLCGTEEIRMGVLFLADTVAARLRKHGLRCQTVQVTIRDPFFKNITRQMTLPQPTDLAKDLTQSALQLIHASWQITSPIRMLTITASHLTDQAAGEQLSLFDADDGAPREKQEELSRALDQIRGKYGVRSVQFGCLIKNDLGILEQSSDEEELPIL